MNCCCQNLWFIIQSGNVAVEGDCVWQAVRNISFAAEHVTVYTCPNWICDQVQCKAFQLFLALTHSKWVTSLKADCLQKAGLHYSSPKMGPLTPSLWGLARLKNMRFRELSQRSKSDWLMEKSYFIFWIFLADFVFNHSASNCYINIGMCSTLLLIFLMNGISQWRFILIFSSSVFYLSVISTRPWLKCQKAYPA